MSIKAEQKPLKDIFNAPYWFSIPVYQRPYLWGKEEILELLDDIYDAYKAANGNISAEYFLGSIVLLKKENEYEVLDGQQRLTTLFIIYTVLSKNEKIKDTGIKNDLLNIICQPESPIRRIPKIIRIKYERVEADKKIKEITDVNYTPCNDNPTIIEDKSARNIVEAYREIEEYFNDSNKFSNELDLINFAQFLTGNTILVDVSANEKTEAFRMFSILNNRGIPLRGADILKAENIGALKSDDKILGTQDWENIENSLKDNELDNFLQFIRVIYLKSKAELSLLEEFEKKIYGTRLMQKGKETIDVLNLYFNIYEDIILCKHKLMNKGKRRTTKIDENLAKYKQLVYIMEKYIKSKDWIPPLMCFYNEFINDISKEHDADRLLRFLEKLEFKFVADWISGEKPSARRNATYAILKKIEEVKRQKLSAEEIINDTVLFNVDEEKLRTILNENVYGEGYATYILLKLEYLCADYSATTEYNRISIEHILPQTVKENTQWSKDFNEKERNYWTHRFANLILLGPTKNTALRNSDFSQKKAKYSGTKGADSFTITKYTLETTEEWTPAVLEKRQKSLIDLFVNNERISPDMVKASVTLD